MFWQTEAARLAGEAIGSRQPSEATARVAVQAGSVMEMKGKDGGGAVIPVSNPAAGTQREKSGSEGFTETPSRLSFSIRDALDYTPASSRPRMPLPAVPDDTKN